MALFRTRGKGMGGVDGDGREQRIDFALVIVGGEFARVGVHLVPGEDANAGFAHGGQQLLIPAAVLVGDEALGLVLHGVERFAEGGAVGRRFVVAVFNALQDAGDANLEELVEIAGGDGEEFDALEQRVGGVLGFFQHTAVEAQPGFVAAEEKALRALWFFPHRGGSSILGTQEAVYLIGYTTHVRPRR